MADERADVTQREACAASPVKNNGTRIFFNSEAASQAPSSVVAVVRRETSGRGDAGFIPRKNPRTANEPERHAATQNDYS